MLALSRETGEESQFCVFFLSTSLLMGYTGAKVQSSALLTRFSNLRDLVWLVYVDELADLKWFLKYWMVLATVEKPNDSPTIVHV
jgi:hypothetical protein